MNQIISAINGPVGQVVSLLRLLAGLGLAIIACLLVAQLLGIRVPYFDAIPGDMTGKAAMLAALAYTLKG